VFAAWLLSVPQLAYLNPVPVMSAPITIYPIWWGDWSDSDKAPIRAFVNGVGASTWWATLRQYTDAYGGAPSDQVAISPFEATARGHAFPAKDELEQVVQGFVRDGLFPSDASGVYVVFLEGAARSPVGCSYHSSIAWGADELKYAVVSPNCVPAAPGDSAIAVSLVATLAHELAETATDPGVKTLATRAWQYCTNVQYWFDCLEVADLCQGEYSVASIGGIAWTLPDLWDNATSSCR
jgi:hypothetical protein